MRTKNEWENKKDQSKDNSHEKGSYNKSEEKAPRADRKSGHGYYNERSGNGNDETTDYTGPRRKENSDETK
jgi:hypothetical protein